MTKANFFIVGVPKAGTTSIAFYLEQHPDIFMSPVKEPNYFSHEDLAKNPIYYKTKNVESIEAYHNLFEGAKNEKAIGEASVSYFSFPNAAKRIKAYDPNAKIVIILRNPIKRAFSHYQMDKRLGFVKHTFNQIVSGENKKEEFKQYFDQFVDIGSYKKHIHSYLEVFGSKNVLILLYETPMEQQLKKIVEFLELDTNFNPDLSQKHNVNRSIRYSWMATLYQAKTLRKLIKLLPGNFIKSLNKAYFSDKPAEQIDEETEQLLKQYYKAQQKELEDIVGTTNWNI